MFCFFFFFFKQKTAYEISACLVGSEMCIRDSGQSNDNLLTMSTAARAESYTDTMNEARYLSFFGRAEYNYLSRYYADISLRRDASSRFGVDSRWANFWSVGGMWNVKGEKFLKNVDWLTNAQLAASIGCLLYTSPSPRDRQKSRMPSSA